MMGAMPLIPPKPMMPIPSAPLNVVLTGMSIVLCIYFFVPGPDNNATWSTSNPKLLMSAVAWDRYLREPPLRFHPVCIAGSLISACLAQTPDRVYKSPILGFSCGLMLLLFMILTMSLGAWFFLESTEVISMYGLTISQKCLSGYSYTLINHAIKFAAWILRVLLLKSTFSLQLLCTIALQMAKFIERDQIDDARGQLSWLCSRDPSKLGPSDLAGGTLESLSENLSDGFVAPLFWYVLLGPIGALAYRVINTLDSRIGYRGKYEWFGKPSARLDDIINYIPARITTILLTLSASILLGRESARKGIQTAWRDHQQCESPNAGWPMACFAGLLSVQLKKEQGEYCLGSSSGKEPTPVDIRTGNRIAVLAGGMSLLLAMITAKMMA
jgi:adenosylcobinamide-phosphate synthase